MSEFDLRGLLAALEDHGVRFVAIGGVAVAAHGYVRATEDLDIVPDSDPDNLGRLATALESLEAILPTAGGRSFQTGPDGDRLRRRESMTLETALGSLDVVQRVAGVPAYPELAETAIDTDLLGVSVSVCSLDHLRRMKQARAGKQDLADLAALPGSR